MLNTEAKLSEARMGTLKAELRGLKASHETLRLMLSGLTSRLANVLFGNQQQILPVHSFKPEPMDRASFMAPVDAMQNARNVQSTAKVSSRATPAGEEHAREASRINTSSRYSSERVPMSMERTHQTELHEFRVRSLSRTLSGTSKPSTEEHNELDSFYHVPTPKNLASMASDSTLYEARASGASPTQEPDDEVSKRRRGGVQMNMHSSLQEYVNQTPKNFLATDVQVENESKMSPTRKLFLSQTRITNLFLVVLIAGKIITKVS